MYSFFTRILITSFLFAFSLKSFATFYSGSNHWFTPSSYVKEEHDNFFLIYKSPAGAFGEPLVGGSTVSFLPDDMSVSQRGRYGWPGNGRGGYNRFFGYQKAADTWTTSIGIIPKDGFDLTTLTLVEQGDYFYDQNVDGGEGTFSITARLFIRDMNNPRNFDFLKLDESFTVDQDVDFDYWDVSETFDISDYADGFWLTIQNTLRVDGKRPYNWRHDVASSRHGHASTCIREDDDEHCQRGDKKHWHKKGWKGHKKFSPADELFLQKKYVGIELGGSTEVPLPASAWLFLTACGSLIFARRRYA